MKVRKVDFSPDEFLVGVMGMKPIDGHTYWVACVLQMSSGGKPININDHRLYSIIDARKPDIKAALERLVEMGKLHRNGDELSNNRARNEIKSAAKRIRISRENGVKGGRPRRVSNDLENPEVSGADNPTEKLSLPPSPPSSTEEESPVAPKGARKRKREEIEYSHKFRTFMGEYPKRGDGRNPWPTAYRAWLAAIERGGDPDKIIAKAKAFALAGEAGTRFIPLASTWLNDDSWKDEAPVVGIPAAPAEPPPELKGWRLAFWRAEGETKYRNYIVPAHVSRSADGSVKVSLPTRFLVDWVRTHYAEKLLAHMRLEDPEIQRVVIDLAIPRTEKTAPENQAAA